MIVMVPVGPSGTEKPLIRCRSIGFPGLSGLESSTMEFSCRWNSGAQVIVTDF